MNILEILRKIGLPEEYLSYFTDSFIMRPTYSHLTGRRMNSIPWVTVR